MNKPAPKMMEWEKNSRVRFKSVHMVLIFTPGSDIIRIMQLFNPRRLKGFLPDQNTIKEKQLNHIKITAMNQRWVSWQKKKYIHWQREQKKTNGRSQGHSVSKDVKYFFYFRYLPNWVKLSHKIRQHHYQWVWNATLLRSIKNKIDR